MHRYSWGSGNSQCSSTSLHSSATLGLGSSGKDDLWAAIQTNYNYIMDTNLLDTCKEARCEIEGAATVLEKSSECSFKVSKVLSKPLLINEITHLTRCSMRPNDRRVFVRIPRSCGVGCAKWRINWRVRRQSQSWLCLATRNCSDI